MELRTKLIKNLIELKVGRLLDRVFRLRNIAVLRRVAAHIQIFTLIISDTYIYELRRQSIFNFDCPSCFIPKTLYGF